MINSWYGSFRPIRATGHSRPEVEPVNEWKKGWTVDGGLLGVDKTAGSFLEPPMRVIRVALSDCSGIALRGLSEGLNLVMAFVADCRWHVFASGPYVSGARS